MPNAPAAGPSTGPVGAALASLPRASSAEPAPAVSAAAFCGSAESAIVGGAPGPAEVATVASGPTAHFLAALEQFRHTETPASESGARMCHEAIGAALPGKEAS
jgi:hypothetical protein